MTTDYTNPVQHFNINENLHKHLIYADDKMHCQEMR